MLRLNSVVFQTLKNTNFGATHAITKFYFIFQNLILRESGKIYYILRFNIAHLVRKATWTTKTAKNKPLRIQPRYAEIVMLNLICMHMDINHVVHVADSISKYK